MYDEKGNKISWKDITCKKCGTIYDDGYEEQPAYWGIVKGILTFTCDECNHEEKIKVYRKISIREALKRFEFKTIESVIMYYMELGMNSHFNNFDEWWNTDEILKEIDNENSCNYSEYDKKVLDERLLEYTENIYKELKK